MKAPDPEKGTFTRIMLNHPLSRIRRFSDNEDLLFAKIESFLKKNDYPYAWRDPADVWGGMMIWLPDVTLQGNYPQKTDDLRQISDLGAFLFDQLKLEKDCLHFIFTEIGVNGKGQLEEIWQAPNELVFEELTGERLSESVKVITIGDFLKLWNEEIKKKYETK